MGHINRSTVSDGAYNVQLLVDLKHPTVRFNRERYVVRIQRKSKDFYHQTSSICHLYANAAVCFIVNNEQGD